LLPLTQLACRLNPEAGVYCGERLDVRSYRLRNLETWNLNVQQQLQIRKLDITAIEE
jgi:hypothetical protein